MDHADRILTFAIWFALLVIGLLVALLFVDATAVAKKITPFGKVPIEVFIDAKLAANTSGVPSGLGTTGLGKSGGIHLIIGDLS